LLDKNLKTRDIQLKHSNSLAWTVFSLVYLYCKVDCLKLLLKTTRNTCILFNISVQPQGLHKIILTYDMCY